MRIRECVSAQMCATLRFLAGRFILRLSLQLEWMKQNKPSGLFYRPCEEKRNILMLQVNKQPTCVTTLHTKI